MAYILIRSILLFGFAWIASGGRRADRQRVTTRDSTEPSGSFLRASQILDISFH